MAFFDGVTSNGSSAESEAIQKALTAGYGTDAATMINGRAMIPENLEATTVNVVAALKEDCKVVNMLKKEPSNSTIHEYNRRTEHGDHRFLSVPEGGSSQETNQSVERATLAMKYLQTRRSVTKQMEVVRTFEGALASEKMSGVETIIKGLENQCIHGDSSVVPTEFDGLIKQILGSSNAYKKDARGATIATLGETIFDDAAQEVWERGGDLKRALFPAVLAKSIKSLFEDKERYIMNNGVNNFSMGLHPYVTAIGSSIAMSGENAGADKFYRVKGKVTAAGSTTQRPSAPTSVSAAAASNASSKFVSADAGNYKYAVHAVNAYGISAGTAVSAAVAIAAGDGVTLTITPASDGTPATGFIITRSAKGGNDLYEMVQCGASSSATTTYVDLNEDLPGTASITLLSEGRIEPILALSQLMPVSTIPLYPTASAETPFLVAFFGALENRAPEFCSLIKNIQYSGGLTY